jgi:hypothetical protein
MKPKTFEREVRRVRHLAAWVNVNGSARCECQVLDISKQGAKVVVQMPEVIPDHFVLAFFHGDQKRTCKSHLATGEDARRAVRSATITVGILGRATNLMNTFATDYYVFTSRRGNHPERWSWQIGRKSKPLGVRLTDDGFQSEAAAQFAGKRALAEFLAELSKEEKRPRK